MKELIKYFVLLLVLPILINTSCKKEEEQETPDPAFTILKDFLKAEGKDLPSIIAYSDSKDGVKFVAPPPATAADVPAFIEKYTIFDLRSAEAFAAGHVEGATNIAFSDILTSAAAAPSDKPILTICYTGQTACYATALLRLSGYRKAQALKWGMAGWNSNFSEKWDNGIGNIAEGSNNWTTNQTATKTFADPTLTETMTDGQTLLDARIATVVADGFKGVGASDVLTNPTDYCINNFFDEDPHTSYGHIAGSYRIKPLSIAGGEINNLDPSAKVVTYCYTGQTSAVVTAFLRVLGYDAYSLKFGMNGLYNSNSAWSGPNQWGVTANPKDLPFVEGK